MCSKKIFTYADTIAVDVFLERHSSRVFAGRLERIKGHYHFNYDLSYLKEKNIISLGPEFPLSQVHFISETVFPSLLDRIPDPQNPAYPDYCAQFGITITESDPLVLLVTIGRRGPSSFIFEPVYDDHYTFKDFDIFRENLGLSLFDAAQLFDVSVSVLQKIKAGESSGKDVLKRLEIYDLFPNVLDYQLKKNMKFLHTDKVTKLFKVMKEARF